MTTDEIRQSFLGFFKDKGHIIHASSSLVPQDPTLLFTSAGMVPFKDRYLGLGGNSDPRAASCQKCLRTGDLENVGLTPRHNTYFEMLGNFSFGDYFKEEAIVWAWEYVTKVVELDPNRISVTIHPSDDEAASIWKNKIGLGANRITKIDDNWWGPVSSEGGPCGPDSEMFWDRGKENCKNLHCGPGCDCGRFEEFWNLVFPQFKRDSQGIDHPLSHRGIDTGMGLERMASIVQGVPTVFDTDEVSRLKDQTRKMLGPEVPDSSVHVVCDHLRAALFLMAEGVIPSNEGRGYVLRRLIRRAGRIIHGAGRPPGSLAGLVSLGVEIWGDIYPEIKASREGVTENLKLEEERFAQTLQEGMDQLKRLRGRSKKDKVSGEDVFKLYDTYGFPEDLSGEVLAEWGMDYDRKGFALAMEKQRERARASWKGSEFKTASAAFQELSKTAGVDSFCGYENLESEAKVTGVFANGVLVSQGKEINEGESVALVLDKTPFYPEGGGQVGDRGRLAGTRGIVEIEDTQRLPGGGVVHLGRVVRGAISSGEKIQAAVEPERRLKNAVHHTGTHLLHAELAKVLGPQVTQAGSLVAPDRLRFDFTYARALTPDQTSEIQAGINKNIRNSLLVETKEMNYKEAIAAGAKAFFQEKYGDVVRVVRIGEVSTELCGGTHLRNSGECGFFVLTSEGSVASGVRRIEALAGFSAEAYIQKNQKLIEDLAGLLRSPKDEVVQKVEEVLKHQKEIRQKLEQAQGGSSGKNLEDLEKGIKGVGLSQVLVVQADGFDGKGLRTVLDSLKSRNKADVIFLASAKQGAAVLLAWVNVQKIKQLSAGKLIQEIAPVIGGRGGGRPDMAQAGGSKPKGISEALLAAEKFISAALKK